MSPGMARSCRKLVYLNLGIKVIGYKPLGKIHQAAKNCELERIEHYLGRGYHIDDTDQKNRIPLHYACAYGNPAVVALLVKRKCSVDLYDSDGNTLLMKAVQYEEEECAIILLENGANPNVHNNKGETPPHCAMFYRNTSIATKLLSFNEDIEAKNKSGQTPLLFAIKKNRQMMVECFIKNKANIHAVDDKGRTALMFAVEHKSTQIVELLLQRGVNVSASDNYGQIALSYAIASGNTVSTKKTHPGDSCFEMIENNYEAHIKNIPEEGGELTEASRQSMKDEVKYDTWNQKSGNLPDYSNAASQKKDVVETLVQAIRIKNDCPFFSSPDSKIFSEGHTQMCVSQSSGEKHCRAKEKADGHVHGYFESHKHSRYIDIFYL
ncbi:Hypothetical predicted protein [Marmota monax]|uniref:Uncharacterized protein n=1 Tax=Marmota monax TaxID=9995 RepID=A0A5E4AS23_MARMO|nr:Hypothetical predicted protein [Marmota monax]